jgi:UDP:flavonoid glycosyltransferase YjiC (YdhE family)
VGRVIVVTWGPGGNLPPLLAAGALMAARGHDVEVLASAATRAEARRSGFPVHGYGRAPEPEVGVAFERRAQALMAVAAGTEVAFDVRDLLRDRRPDLAIVDCMLPGAAVAAATTGTPTASLVHFLYGLARRGMHAGGGAWTTDLATLNDTRRALGLRERSGGLDAWEASELVLVTAPRWLDLDLDYPPHVVHAGPLGIDAHPQRRPAAGRPKVLLSFSTTVMDGQPRMIRTACEGVAARGAEAVLTLGPAVAEDQVDAPEGVEVLAWPTTMSSCRRAPPRSPTPGSARRCARSPTASRS